jgi:CsoR family transcriptional regulator, copper-sensing transcriptional repressor
MKKNADHSSDLQRLRRISGQVEGIKKMIEEKRYCTEILMQTKAVRAAVKALEVSILEKHLNHCVVGAFESKSKIDSQKKMNEILDLFAKSLV